MPYVLLVDGNNILSAGLASLLTEKQSLQLEHLTETDDLSILDAIERRQPDVIVITETFPDDVTHILRLLETAYPDSTWRIMIVHQKTNRIDLYDKRQVMINHRQDVLDLFNDSLLSSR
jgi:DNA-binding NarL/FixJ family response regulator